MEPSITEAAKKSGDLPTKTWVVLNVDVEDGNVRHVVKDEMLLVGLHRFPSNRKIEHAYVEYKDYGAHSDVTAEQAAAMAFLLNESIGSFLLRPGDVLFLVSDSDEPIERAMLKAIVDIPKNASVLKG